MTTSGVEDSGRIFRLDGQSAIVTGAGSGIGRAIAEIFVRAGADLVVADRDETALAVTISKLEAAGGRFRSVVDDVSRPQAAGEIVQACIEAFGRVDILVNNAGIYPPGASLPDVAWDVLDRTLAINFNAPLRLISAASARMNPGARIINISSMESLRPSGPGLIHYTATKAALNALTRQAAVDLAPLGIRANAILPGLIHTEGTGAMPETSFEAIAARAPSRRIGLASDIAAAALFLASDGSSYVNGHCLVVDGGITVSA